MQSKPYRLLGNTEIRQYQARVKSAFDKWIDGWNCNEPVASISGCGSPISLPQGGVWHRIAFANDRWIYVHASDEALSAAARYLFGEACDVASTVSNAAETVMFGVLRQSLIDLCVMVAGELAGNSGESVQLVSNEPPAAAGRMGSGVMLTKLIWDKLELTLVIAPGLLEARPLRRSPRSPQKLQEALSGKTVCLKVIGGEAEIELGLLQTISVGDVVKLENSINDPLQVVCEGKALHASAYLGAVQGKKAVLIVKTKG